MSTPFLDKSVDALGSAEFLLGYGDYEGAANRAYFAMFHAARAALVAVDPTGAGRIRTHRSVIGNFSLLLVRKDLVAMHLGRWLNATEELRIAADYDLKRLDDPRSVAQSVERAGVFIQDITRLLDRLAKSGPTP